MMFDKITLAAGVALGLLIASGPAYLYGKHVGASGERADQLAKSIELIQKRGKTNAEVSKLDDGALCSELGGRWVQNNCE